MWKERDVMSLLASSTEVGQYSTGLSSHCVRPSLWDVRDRKIGKQEAGEGVL